MSRPGRTPPTAKSRKRNNLKVGWPHTHTSRRLNETIFLTRILVAPRRQAGLNGFNAIHHLPGHDPTAPRYILVACPRLHRAKNLELQPRIQFTRLGRKHILLI